MIGWVILAAVAVVGIALWLRHEFHLAVEDMEKRRFRQNERVRRIHQSAGNRWYPHVMADGTVRWYPVSHEYAVDL